MSSVTNWLKELNLRQKHRSISLNFKELKQIHNKAVLMFMYIVNTCLKSNLK